MDAKLFFPGACLQDDILCLGAWEGMTVLTLECRAFMIKLCSHRTLCLSSAQW